MPSLSGAPVDVTQAELDAHTDDTAIHSSGRELGYAQSAAQQTTTSTAADGEAFSPAITTTVEVGARPIRVIARCEYALNGTDNAQVFLVLLQDGVNIGNQPFRCSEANDFGLIVLERRLSLTPDEYVFSLNKRVSAGTGTYMQFGYQTTLHVIEV